MSYFRMMSHCAVEESYASIDAVIKEASDIVDKEAIYLGRLIANSTGSSTTPDESAARHLRMVFGEFDKSSMMYNFLFRVFLGKTRTEKTWPAIAYVGEVARFVRNKAVASQSGILAPRLLWHSMGMIDAPIAHLIKRVKPGDNKIKRTDIEKWGKTISDRVSWALIEDETF